MLPPKLLNLLKRLSHDILPTQDSAVRYLVEYEGLTDGSPVGVAGG
jgi:hypothetical protein